MGKWPRQYTDRQTDGQIAKTIDRQMHRWTDQQQTIGQIDGQMCRQANLWIDAQTNNRLMGTRAVSQACRKAGRKACKW
jgi:hypothetical protein